MPSASHPGKTGPTSSGLATRIGRGARLPKGYALLRRPTALLSLVILLLFIITALLAPQLAPHDPNLQSLRNRLAPPIWVADNDGHVLGTDSLGRDVLSNLIFGSRLSLTIGLITMVLGALIGSVAGIIAGYFGGLTDTIIMRIVDVWMAFPSLLLALIFAAVLGQGITSLIVALVLTSWPLYTRVIRSEVLSLRQREFITAVHALGSRHARILLRHLLPNVLPLLLVLSTLQLGVTIITEASLSFLGVGVDPSIPTWGSMLAGGRRYMRTAWWLTAFPGIAISVVVLAINIFGDYLRDVYDPRRRY